MFSLIPLGSGGVSEKGENTPASQGNGLGGGIHEKEES
jgi:hypothetical protein